MYSFHTNIGNKMKIATIIRYTIITTDFLQEVICIQVIRLRKFYTNSQKIDSAEDFSLDLFLDLHLDLIRLKKDESYTISYCNFIVLIKAK